MRRLSWTLGAVAFVVIGAISNTSAQSPDMQRLADELAVIHVTNEIDVAVDRKDWPKAPSSYEPTFFADELRADFTSLTGLQSEVHSTRYLST